MNQAFLRGLLSELEKRAEQPQTQMMQAIPPDVLAALMGEPVEYEEPSMLQMLLPSIGLGAAGLGVGAAAGPGAAYLARRFGTPMSNLRANLAAKAGPLLSRMNPMRFLRKGASEKLAGMPFLRQDRPRKVKEIYSAIKRSHPEMPAAMKARIAARQGKPGKQSQGPPYSSPLTPKTAGHRQEVDRDDPSGYVGLMLKAMRRAGKGGNERIIRAFHDLAYNVPTNK